jgi:hypothetical protein
MFGDFDFNVPAAPAPAPAGPSAEDRRKSLQNEIAQQFNFIQQQQVMQQQQQAQQVSALVVLSVFFLSWMSAWICWVCPAISSDDGTHGKNANGRRRPSCTWCACWGTSRLPRLLSWCSGSCANSCGGLWCASWLPTHCWYSRRYSRRCACGIWCSSRCTHAASRPRAACKT